MKPKAPKTLTFPGKKPKKTGPKYPSPPAHLSPEMRTFWRKTVRAWDLDDDHLEVLRLACTHIDRAAQARKIIEAEGLVQKDRFEQWREHPAVKIERASSVTAARLLRQLDLSDELPRGPGRPPEGFGG